MKKQILSILTLLALMPASVGLGAAADSGWRAKLSVILSSLPAAGSGQSNKWISELVGLGPRAVEELCRRLAGPQESAAVRFALSGLVDHAARAGAVGEKKMVVAAFNRMLPAAGMEAKRFLTEQLQWLAGEESLPVLASLLADAQVGDAAVRALQAIGTARAQKTLLDALQRPAAVQAPAIIQALGELRSRAASQTLLRLAAGNNPFLRQPALAALANLGVNAATPLFFRMLEIPASAQRAEALPLILLHARRLAENGEKKTAETVCRVVLAMPLEARENQWRVAALDTLAALLGPRVLADLLLTAPSENRALRQAALRLALNIPGEQVTAAWVSLLERALPEIRADIADMLGRRKDRSALPALRRCLQDDDPQVRLAAIPAYARLAGSPSMPALFAILQKGRYAEIDAAREALLTLEAGPLLAELGTLIPQLPPTAAPRHWISWPNAAEPASCRCCCSRPGKATTWSARQPSAAWAFWAGAQRSPLWPTYCCRRPAARRSQRRKRLWTFCWPEQRTRRSAWMPCFPSWPEPDPAAPDC